MSLYAIAGGAATAAAVGFGAGYWLANTMSESEIAALKLSRASEQLLVRDQALNDLRTAGLRISQAAGDFAQTREALAQQSAQIAKELRNAKPLPADCKPGAERLRALGAAVAAANAAASGQRLGGTVPAADGADGR